METRLTRSRSFRLEVGQIDIWLTSLYDVRPEQLPGYLALLTEAERVRWQRFVAPDAKLQYLLSRALVRTTLSRYADVGGHEWQFEANRYGRPHVSRPKLLQNVQFNLSNTTGLVACAVSRDCDIGVDVENISRTLDIEALAPTVFVAAELADIRQCQPGERRDRFFAYWTLKEAYIKARGMGLSLPLDGFWFDLGGASPLLRVSERCPDDPLRWRFFQYAPGAQHRLALAVAAPRGTEPSVRLRWIVPVSTSSQPTLAPAITAGGPIR
jgi:4'-phosphopantetheinyl transferase